MHKESHYRIRVSPRAKRVSLRLDSRGELEVVVPRGFDQRRLPQLVEGKRRWLERARSRMQEYVFHREVTGALPQHIALPACHEEWRVERITRRPARLRVLPGNVLHLQCGEGDDEAGIALLRRWVSAHARECFQEKLGELCGITGLRYRRLQVRTQRTRWGSYSSRATLSLNAKLLFCSPAQMRYVLIHELCHSVHMDHSPRFWALVETFEPDWRRLRRELRHAWRQIPGWMP
jgi:predicted metal-dependent hydrolase